MSAPPSRKGRNGLILPLALTATAAVASFALWYFLNDDESEHNRRRHNGHESGDEIQRRTDRSSTRRRSPPTTDRDFGKNPSSRAPNEFKKSIALVVRESTSSSQLLSHLPTPFPLDRANIFVLIYSPDITAHPLSDSDAAAFENKGAEGKVYRQARKLYPKDSPRELVMPFTDIASLVPMLKQLGPGSVYIEGSLVGEDAEIVRGVMEHGWIGAMVIAVEDPHTGQRLADSTGRFGKSCRVIDVEKAGGDWLERVG